MHRRAFLATGAGAVTAGLAGCTAEQTGGDDDGGDDGATDGGTTGEVEEDPTLTIATYDTLIDAPTTSPGEWIKDEFEARHDVELEWAVPDGEVNHYIQEYDAGVDLEPEVYLGLKPSDLYRVDDSGVDLFSPTDRNVLEHAARIDESFEFDPDGRVIPTYQNFCAIVYDGRNIDEPEGFEDLLDPMYEGEIGIPNPMDSDTGEMFLLSTIKEFGPDGYLDYWEDLLEENAVVLSSWSEMYPQFEANELNVVVSFSNDRVYADMAGNDMDKHRVTFLEDTGYANLNGMARFATGSDDELAHAFMDFILEDETQRAIAELNVTGPVTDVEPPETYREFAKEPGEIVHFEYPELREHRSTWLEDWERQVAGGR